MERHEILEKFQQEVQTLPTEWLEDALQKMADWKGITGDVERTAALAFLSGTEFMDTIHDLARVHPALLEIYLVGVDVLNAQHKAWYQAELERRKNAPAEAPANDE